MGDILVYPYGGAFKKNKRGKEQSIVRAVPATRVAPAAALVAMAGVAPNEPGAEWLRSSHYGEGYGSHPFLVMGMIASSHNRFARELVRETMLSVVAPSTVFRFVIGQSPEGEGPGDEQSLDMFVVEGVHDGGNVAKQCVCIHKTHEWFSYASHRWKKATYYAKTEEDTYINLPQLLHDLHRPEVLNVQDLMYGLIGICSQWVLPSSGNPRPANPPKTACWRPGSCDACFLGDFEHLDGHRLAKIWDKWKTRTPEICQTAPPAPFPTGPLAVFSNPLTRAIFRKCEYQQRFMEVSKQWYQRTGGCSLADPNISVVPSARATCDCALGAWLERCVRKSVVASMTWTKGHHFAVSAGGQGWVRPDRQSMAVHGLKQPKGKKRGASGHFAESWRLTHNASSASSVTLFPPLLWDFQPSKSSYKGPSSLRPLRNETHNWYREACNRKWPPKDRVDELKREGMLKRAFSWREYGCHQARFHPPAVFDSHAQLV